MTEYRAKAHGFNSEITAIVEVKNGEILKISAEGEVPPNTVDALGVDNWLEEANAEHSVEVDAISGASVSTGALRKATQMAYAEATSGDVDAISSASIHNQPNNYPLLKEKFYEGDIEFDDEYDVIVVGAGGAGLSAAATAAENGASVLAIEKQGIPGGTTSLSGGVMQAAGAGSDPTTQAQVRQAVSGAIHQGRRAAKSILGLS
ncbi:FAD-dependent oxidoreductase [Lactobacillus delbrueckii subsp. bulgaricus]